MTSLIKAEIRTDLVGWEMGGGRQKNKKRERESSRDELAPVLEKRQALKSAMRDYDGQVFVLRKSDSCDKAGPPLRLF